MFRHKIIIRPLMLLGLGVALGYWASHATHRSGEAKSLVSSALAAEKAADSKTYSYTTQSNLHLLQSPAARAIGASLKATSCRTST